MKHVKKTVTVAAVALTLGLASGLTFASVTDQVPADAKGVTNPVEADDEDVLKAAKKVYKKKCKKCHGKKGNGKGPGAKDMEPSPPDWTGGIDATDGELFWLTMNGSKDTEMKGWKEGSAKAGKEITDEQAWSLVHYMRSLVK
ncbi:hypothetical protein MNBD_GAMMA26-1974 [hydrothermal vent metagenome]|uniref:Cytochrome c domain-containing protein n=1 Tax=hydrothermal vent metagenome TaxID=652676 RepID=A0A3B1B6B9_9ZZZZ